MKDSKNNSSLNFYQYVFVILVYRNISDLEECILSIKRNCTSYKVVVVNAYYDEDTCKQVKMVTEKYDCDFMNVENKGYSFGNNAGIENVARHFDFDYLVVSNPDITIEEFNDDCLKKDFCYDIIAPKIIAANGRPQNPMYVRKPRLSEWLEYVGFKYRKNFFVHAGIFLSKLNRNIGMYLNKDKTIYEIYGAHGSFVMLSRRAVENLIPVYDDNMFLFAEEMVLAAKSHQKGLRTCYYNGIFIKHKEDGSMKLSNFNLYEELRKSNLYYFAHYSQC